MQLKDPSQGTKNAWQSQQSQLVFLIKANKQQNDHKSFEDAIARALHSVCNIKAGRERERDRGRGDPEIKPGESSKQHKQSCHAVPACGQAKKNEKNTIKITEPNAS